MMAAILKILRFAILSKKPISFGVKNDRRCQFLSFDAEMKANTPLSHLRGHVSKNFTLMESLKIRNCSFSLISTILSQKVKILNLRCHR